MSFARCNGKQLAGTYRVTLPKKLFQPPPLPKNAYRPGLFLFFNFSSDSSLCSRQINSSHLSSLTRVSGEIELHVGLHELVGGSQTGIDFAGLLVSAANSC